MFTVIETIYNRDGGVIAKGKYERVSWEAAEKEAAYLRNLHIGFGAVEGVGFTIELKAA